MSEPNQQKDEGTSTDKAPTVSRERFASVWKGLAFAFVGTLVAAAVVFVWRRELLLGELQDHYSRSAARQAREMELAYSTFSNVLTNLTRLSDPVGEGSTTRLRANAASARLNALTRAEQRVQVLAPSTANRLVGPDPEREQLGRELLAASQQLADADASLREQQKDAATTMEALLAAQGEAKSKIQAAADAAKVAREKARAAVEAANAAVRAETHADAADRTGATADQTKAHQAAAEARDAAQTADISTVGNGSGSGAGSSVGIDGARSRAAPAAPSDPKKAAVDAAERAKKASLAAALEARDAQEAADQAERQVDARARAADEARVSAVRAFVARGRHTTSMQGLEAAIKARSEENARVAERQPGLDVERRALSNDLRLAAEEQDAIAALMNGLRASILPSYRDEVDACITQNLATPKDAEVCAAREMARAVEAPGSAPAMELAGCPPGPERRSKAALGTDGKSLVFSPASGMRALSACGHVPLAKLVTSSDVPGAPADPSSARPFDEVLLLRPDGKLVFAREGGSNLRVTALPGVGKEGVRVSQIVAGVEIGPRKYRAFLQPVSIAVADACPDGACAAPKAERSADAERVVFCGLVAEDRLVAEGLEVSPGFFLWAILLLCLGVLAIPLAKLWLVGPTSRFRRFDVALLAVSALATTLLTVMFVLATTIYAGLVARLDEQLSSVSGPVAENVMTLVNRALADLDDYDKDSKAIVGVVPQVEPDGASLQAFQKACLPPPLPPPDGKHRFHCKKWEVLTYPSGTRRGRGAAVCEQVSCQFQDDGTDNATIGFATDRLGNQWVRSSSQGHAPNPTNVADRPYFQRALRDELSCFPAPTRDGKALPKDNPGAEPRCEVRAAAEVVRSNTLGEVVLVMARPTKVDDRVTGVMGVARPFTGLDNTVLPLGLEVAIVDRLGRVMVHSDGDTRQGQYLFDDFGKPDELAAAMAAGVPAVVGMRYRGSPSRVLVERLPSLDWYVLTVAPRGIVDVVTANIVGLALVGWGVLLLVFWLLVMVPLVYLLRRRRERLGPTSDGVPFLSVRPNSNHVRSYSRAGFVMLAGTAVVSGTAVVFDLATVPLLIASLVAAMFGLLSVPGVGLFASSRTRPASDPPEDRASAEWWRQRWLRHFLRSASLPNAYALCCFGLAGIAVVAPTFILVEAARDHMLDGLIRAEQNHYATRLGNKECLERVVAGKGNVTNSHCPHVYASGLNPPGPELKPRSDHCLLWPAPCVAEQLPVLESSDRRATGRLYRDPRFMRTDDRVTMVEHVMTDGKERLAGIVATELPRLRSAHVPYFVAGVVSLALAAFLGYLLTRASAERLLALGLLEKLQDAGDLPLELVLPESVPDGHRCLVINPSPELRAAIAKRALAPVLLIADFDDQLSNLERLGMLEGTISNPKAKVVLLSKREPMRQAPSELRARWATVLKDFTVRKGPPFPEPSLDPGLRDIPPARLAAHWDACTKEEQRVLAQLATEGFVNPHVRNHRPLAELAGRGLLDFHTLTIQHEGFRAFAAEQVSQTEFAQWEKDDSSSVYRSLRVPLLAGVVMIFAVVSAVNPGLAAVAPLVPALAAGLPPLLKILATMMSGKPAAPG